MLRLFFLERRMISPSRTPLNPSQLITLNFRKPSHLLFLLPYNFFFFFTFQNLGKILRPRAYLKQIKDAKLRCYYKPVPVTCQDIHLIPQAHRQREAHFTLVPIFATITTIKIKHFHAGVILLSHQFNEKVPENCIKIEVVLSPLYSVLPPHLNQMSYFRYFCYSPLPPISMGHFHGFCGSWLTQEGFL